jgi:7-carboxy-7-deazaguanine synthase
MNEYQVHEMFRSIQGEGLHAGCTATFIRLQGCPVGCPWCDAKRTWYAGGVRMSVEMIVKHVNTLAPSKLLIVTGGEPLIYDLDTLFLALTDAFPKREIHLETSGAYPFKGHMRPHWTTLSPKRAAHWKVAPSVLDAADEIKVVIDAEYSDDDLTSLYWLATFAPVSLMPEGAPPTDTNVQRVLSLLDDHPTWRFCPRLQYDYPAITAREGDTNEKISITDARAESRQIVEARRD